MSKAVSTCEQFVAAPEIVIRLEQAGMTLLALRLSRGAPAQPRVAWPDYEDEFWFAYNRDTNKPGESEVMRPPIPPASKITEMDRTLAWIGLIPSDRAVLRRIVGARALVNPLTERHLFSWRKLGRVLGADHRAVQTWHAQGIALITAALNKKIACQTVQNLTFNLSSSRDRAPRTPVAA